MTQTIVISSGKGGVGKTNISVNAAIELAQRNYRTCLFDADLGLANVNILLGIHPENSLDDYIFGDKNLNEIVLPTKFGIDVIPGSSGIKSDAGPHQEDDLNGFWQRYFDYTLQDLALPECPGIRKTARRSFQLLSPANAGDGRNHAE